MNQPEPNPMNQVAPVPPKQPLVTPWLLITFIIVLLAGGGYMAWYFLGQPKTATEAPVVTTATPTTKPVTTPTTTPTTTDATTALTYTNDAYGFTLTFPATWKGYKMKEANITGVTKTYYVNFPTKDATATANTTADAGYFSPFALSVYTLAEWAAVEASDGPKDTLIMKNATYAFGWSHANGVPPADFTFDKDIATIIASFKLK